MLIVLSYGVSQAALTLSAIFQGLLLPAIPVTGGGLLPEVTGRSPLPLVAFYLASLGLSILVSAIISDLGPSLLSFFTGYGLAAFTTYQVLALPETLGMVQFNGGVEQSAVNFTFAAFFPILFLISLVGALAGNVVSNRFFSTSLVL